MARASPGTDPSPRDLEAGLPERRVFLSQLASSCAACALAGMARPSGAAPLDPQDPAMGLTSIEDGGLNPRPGKPRKHGH